MSFDEFQECVKCFFQFVGGDRLLGGSTFYKDGGVLVVLGVFILLVALVGALIISRGVERTVVRAI